MATGINCTIKNPADYLPLVTASKRVDTDTLAGKLALKQYCFMNKFEDPRLIPLLFPHMIC